MVSKDRLFWAQPAWRRAVVIAAGVAMNFIIGWFILSLVFMIGSPSAVVVDGVQEGSPAATVGIKSGDILVGYHTTDEFIKVVDEHRGALVTFHILRDGKEMTVEAAPRVSPPAGEGALGVVLVQAGMPSEGFFAAIAGGFKESLRACGFIISALYGVVKDVLLRGETVSGDVAGPIGIVAIARGVGQIGLVYLLQLVSLISLNLAIINLVPFPALDGGRLFTILIEKIKGSPVPRRAEEIANRIGFAFLLVLMAFITVHDIARIW
jgi:regulator of sigma E protease